jgi:hypothetical protein
MCESDLKILRTCLLVLLDENNPGNKLSDKNLTGLLMASFQQYGRCSRRILRADRAARTRESSRAGSRLHHRQSTSIAFYTIELYDVKCSL